MSSLVTTPELEAVSVFDKAAFAAYEALKVERNELKQMNAALKKQVEALEEKNKLLRKPRQVNHEEHELLKNQIENDQNSRRIQEFQFETERLEKTISHFKSENQLLKNEIAVLQMEVSQLADRKEKVLKQEKTVERTEISSQTENVERTEISSQTEDVVRIEISLQTEDVERTEISSQTEDVLAEIEKENESMKEKIEALERQQNELEDQISKHGTETSSWLYKYKDLKADYLKMETKYKKQKALMDEELNDAKEVYKKLIKERDGLKTTLLKVHSNMTSLNQDHMTAKKQLEKQSLELDNLKRQSSAIKRSVYATKDEYISITSELRNNENTLENASNFWSNRNEEERRARYQERKLQKHVDELEKRVQELLKENDGKDMELYVYRKKLETLLNDAKNGETTLKRRPDFWEKKQTIGNEKKDILVTMEHLRLKHPEIESNTQTKSRNLDMQNPRLFRRARDTENDKAMGVVDAAPRPFRPRLRPIDAALLHEMAIEKNREAKSAETYRLSERQVRSLPGLSSGNQANI